MSSIGRRPGSVLAFIFVVSASAFVRSQGTADPPQAALPFSAVRIQP